MIIRCLLMLWITVLVTGCTLKDEEQIITEAWHSGETLPVEIGKKYPPAPIAMTIDKGYNVLIDLSHQCSFNFMWGLPDMLHQKDFVVYRHKPHSVVSWMRRGCPVSVFHMIRNVRFILLPGILILDIT